MGAVSKSATRTLEVILSGNPVKMQAAFASAVKGATGAKLAMGATVLAAAAVGKALYDVGSEFEHANNIIKAGTGETGKRLNRLEDDFKAVVSGVPASFEDVATAVTEVHKRLDLIGGPNRRLSHQFLELSRMTGGDLTGNIKNVARALEDWDVPVKQQSSALDLFFRASQKSGIGVEELSEQVDKFGPQLRNLHIPLGKAVALFASFEKAGVSNTKMGMALNLAFKNLVDGTANVAKKIAPKDTGKKVFELFRGMETGAVSAERAFEVFGSKGGGALIQAVKQGRFHVAAFQKEIESSSVTINKAGEETKTTSDHFHELGNKLKVLVAPAAEAVYDEVNKLAGQLAKVNFKKLLREMGLTSQTFREVGQAIDRLGHTFGPVLEEMLKGGVAAFKGFMQAVKGIAKIISGVLTGDFGKAWGGVKDIFSGGVKASLGISRAMRAPLVAAAKAMRRPLEGAFKGIWDGISSVFEAGAEQAIGWVQRMADVLNILPGVDIQVPTLSGGGSSPKSTGKDHGSKPASYNKRYSGGPITRPMAIVGEEAPQHHEWVIATNPAYRKNNLGYWAQAGKDLGVPGFKSGGVMGVAEGVGSALTEPFGIAKAVAGGAAAVIGKLPKPHLPEPFSGLGSYALSQVAGWLKGKFASLASAGGGVGGYTGPPANMSQLGNNAYVDSHTLAVTAFLDKQFGLTMTSGYRSPAHNAAIGGAPGSLHTHGSPGNPGATDSAGSMGAMQSYIAFARQHVAGLQEAMVDDVGNGPNAHLGFFAKGGFLGAFKGGGPLDSGELKHFNARVGRIWEAAAPFFGQSPRSKSPATYPGPIARRGDAGLHMVNEDGSESSFLSYGRARALAKGSDASEGTLLHEWAHNFQKGLRGPGKKWLREGGAEAFKFLAGEDIMHRAGLPYESQPISASYKPYYDAVMQKGRRWALRGQFGLARGGKFLGAFKTGGKLPSWVHGGSTLGADQLASLAHYVGMPNPGLMAQIAQGESSGNPGVTNSIGARGLWQIIPSTAEAVGADYGSLTDPLANARAASKVLSMQGLGAWEAYTNGSYSQFSKGTVSPLGRASGGSAKAAQERRKKERENFKFGLQQHKPVLFPPLKSTPLSPAAKLLPKGVQHMLESPGLKYAGKVAISELALGRSEQHKEMVPALDAAGNPILDENGQPVMVDTHEDDRAILSFQQSLYSGQRKRLKKRLNAIDKALHKNNTPAQRKKLLAQRTHVTEELGTAESNLSGIRDTLKGYDEEDPAAKKQTEAMEALTKAMEDHAAEEKALREELKRQTDFATSATATGSAVAWQALSDILSGTLGPRAYRSAQTAGAGSVGRY